MDGSDIAAFSNSRYECTGHRPGGCDAQRMPSEHPSPKKSAFSQELSTTASLPCLERTVSLILPFWM